MENKPVLKKVRRPINRVMSATTNTKFENNNSSLAREGNFGIENNIQQTRANAVQNVNLPAINDASYQNNSHAEEEINYIDENNYTQEVYGYEDDEARMSVKLVIVIAIICLLLGLLSGKLLFKTSQTTQNGLQGVVYNSEIPRGRARCGLTESSQGCVLYLMNPKRQNIKAKDFYEIAAQMTGRQKFMIETGNMRYSNVEIRPGDIAQLNIPPL